MGNRLSMRGGAAAAARAREEKTADRVTPEDDVMLFHPRKRRPSDLSMQTLLQEPVLSGAFRTFMMEKFCEELVVLWADLYSYERIPYESPAKLERAQELYLRYFDERSPLTLARSEHIDAGTVHNLRRNLLVDEEGNVQQRNQRILASAFKFVYAKVLTVLKFEYMPQFLVSERFSRLDEMSTSRPAALMSSPILARSAALSETSMISSSSSSDDLAPATEASAEPSGSAAPHACGSPSLDSTAASSAASGVNLDGDEGAEAAAAAAAALDLVLPGSDELASAPKRAPAGGESPAAAQPSSPLGFQARSAEEARQLSVPTVLTDPFVSSFFLEFIHSDEISSAVDKLLASDADASPTVTARRSVSASSASTSKARTRSGSSCPESSSSSGSGGGGSNASSAQSRRRRGMRAIGLSKSLRRHGSAAFRSVPRPSSLPVGVGLRSSKSASNIAELARKAEQTSAQAMFGALSVPERVDKALALRSARDMVELFLEIEDFRNAESNPKHQFDRLRRIFVQYGGERQIIQPPIEFLERHFAHFEKKIARYRDVVFMQRDVSFFDPVRATVMERLAKHVMPLFHQSATFSRMISRATNTSNLVQAERTQDSIRRLARFAEQRKFCDHSSLTFSLESALALPWGAFYLKRFARKSLQEESVLFVLEVGALETFAANVAATDLRPLQERAVRLCELYVLDSAPLQVNISHQQRDAVIRHVYEQGNVSPDVFADARAEVLRVLKLNLWPAFQQDPMYDNFVKKCMHNLHRSSSSSPLLSEDGPLLRPSSGRMASLQLEAAACPAKAHASARFAAPSRSSANLGRQLTVSTFACAMPRSSSAHELRPTYSLSGSPKSTTFASRLAYPDPKAGNEPMSAPLPPAVGGVGGVGAGSFFGDWNDMGEACVDQGLPPRLAVSTPHGSEATMLDREEHLSESSDDDH